MTSETITLGDNVRIVRSPETSQLGLADRVGVCHGFTTPSVTGVEVVGDLTVDLAYAVHFQDDGHDETWFSPDLVELVDHAAGTKATVGDRQFVKADDGTWVPWPPRATPRRRGWLRRG